MVLGTLGARDFSSAVSGFCQVFIVTHLRKLFPFENSVTFPAAREKNLWYPGYRWVAQNFFISLALR